MESTHIKHEEETIEMHCDICLTDYTFHKNEKLRPASICYTCWSNHIRTYLTRISYQMGNPILAVGEGEEPIDVCEAINSLQDDERNELEEWLFKKYTTFTPDIEKCPSETCDFVFTMQKCRWRANQELCPKCETKLSTDNRLQLRSLAGIIYFILIANKCPRCEIPIEKTSGCPHMTCPCGHQFCWFCLKDHHQNDRNVYAVHENKECFSVVVSKVLILMMCLTSLIIACSGNDSSKGLFSILIYCVVGFLKALLLNFVLAINAVTANHFFYIYKYRWSKKAFAVGLGLLLCMDLAFLLGLNYCDLLEDILSIFFFEVTLVAIGGALFWIGYHLYETWFMYIA